MFACQGRDHALWEATSLDVGTKWTKEMSLGGSLIGRPAIAPSSPVPELLVEGTNHALWARTSKTPWTSIVVVVVGVGAAVLG